jgi:HlyD family secretion protein
LRWIVASGLVLVLGVGGWLGYRTWQSSSVAPVVVTTGTPSRDTLENRVDASGIMSLGNQQILKAPADVTVEAVLVEERQRVERGTVLLRLRDRSLEQELDEAQIQTEIFRLQRQRNAELLQDHQRTVRRAKERLTESRSLVDQGFISEDEYNEDRNALETAQSELRGAEVELQRSELEIRQNQAKLTNVRARIADNAIVAPFDAVVLNIEVQPGDGVQSEGTLLTIGDPNQEVVLFDLMTLDANKVSVNMPVRVSIIGPNPEKYIGRVISIAPQAISDSNGDGDGGGSQAMVKAIAQLERPSGVLIPGSSVSVEVILVQRESVLALPANALHQEGGETYAWVVDSDSKVQKRTVTTGLDTLDAVEIVSGLEETDLVILALPPAQPLSEGMVVETPGAPQNSGS